MQYRYAIVDVFTDRPFTGNQLAVFPDAQGIGDRAMQAIAREFNFPETTYVLPPRDARHARRVRIFTPKTEMPFAGHPTVGTAAALLHLGLVEAGNIVFEEGIGPVPVELARRDGAIHAHLSIEKPVEIANISPAHSQAAAALSLPETSVLDAWFGSAGVKFTFILLADKAAVDRAVLDRAAWQAHFSRAWSSNLYLLAGDTSAPGPLYVRMFGPALGIDEDPATGSGAVALAGILAGRLAASDGTFTWIIDQGVAMGRPSRLEAIAEKRAGRVVRMKVGGASVVVAEGTMVVD